MNFTERELAYLRSQRLGRLATLAPDGGLQNNPVGFTVDDQGHVLVHGRALGRSRKFRNVRGHAQVAFVVDDIASVRPWRVRCVEIRGTAEALEGVQPPYPYFSHEQIRITPDRVISFGLDEPTGG